MTLSVIDLISKILVCINYLNQPLLSWINFLLPFQNQLIVLFNLLAEENEDLIYVKFFKFYRCYDLIPLSAKLVVFDTQLLVKKAFFALVNNGKLLAPLILAVIIVIVERSLHY